MENIDFLTKQIITYIGNKRKFLDVIAADVLDVLNEIGKEKGVICDLFSGSGVVARKLKQYSSILIVNDLENYCYVINDCYLTNKSCFNDKIYEEFHKYILSKKLIEGVINS